MRTSNLMQNYLHEQPISHVNQVPPFDAKVSEEEAFGSKEDEFSHFFNRIQEIEDKIQLLDREFYVLVNPEEIEEFLFAHDYLFDFLFEAKDRIAEYFKHSVDNIYLELHQDPEEDSEELFMIVRTELPLEEAFSLLNRLDEQWWLQVDANIRRCVEIDIQTK